MQHIVHRPATERVARVLLGGFGTISLLGAVVRAVAGEWASAAGSAGLAAVLLGACAIGWRRERVRRAHRWGEVTDGPDGLVYHRPPDRWPRRGERSHPDQTR